MTRINIGCDAFVERDDFGVFHICSSDGFNGDIVSLSERDALTLARAITALVSPSGECPHGARGVRCDECYAALLKQKLSSENGQQVSELVAEIACLRADNERLSKAVCSGLLGDLLTPDESESLVTFVRGLRRDMVCDAGVKRRTTSSAADGG